MQAHWENQLMALAGRMSRSAAEPFHSYWAGDRGLDRAYRFCADITARHSKSFHLASQLLPAEKRSATRALYAFSRTVDDIVDEPAHPGHERRLDYWRTVVEHACAPETDPIGLAWADTLRRYAIPRHLALQLIDGVARDLVQDRYANFDDLSTYCYGVASTVGLMSMCIIGFASEEAVSYAIKLGVALQLTNILRDVGEDFRNGRVYLPQDELRAFGLSEGDLALGQPTETWRRFMRFQLERARQLYVQAWPGIALLSRDGRLAIGAAANVYRAILDRIEANGYDVFTRRANLSGLQKLSLLPPLWFQLRRGAPGLVRMANQ
jgi:phytoene synthase